MREQSHILVRLLAESHLSENEIRIALLDIVDGGLKEFIAEILHYRNIGRTDAGEKDVLHPHNKRRRSESDPYSDESIAQVTRLLRDEARLTAAQAAAELLRRLASSYPIPNVRGPEVTKISFNEWVWRLSSHVPMSAILQSATAIRNARTHTESAWPLKR